MLKAETNIGYTSKSGTAIVLERFDPFGSGIHALEELVKIDSIAPIIHHAARLRSGILRRMVYQLQGHLH